MQNIDTFLREMLIDWALEDLNHPIKYNTLSMLSKEDWRTHLYQSEKAKRSDTIKERLKEELIRLEQLESPKGILLGQIPTKEELKKEAIEGYRTSYPLQSKIPYQSPTDLWLQTLLKEIHVEIKAAYKHKFQVNKWAMKKVETTGAFYLGPVNAWNEVFMRFEILYKDGVVFWNIKTNRSKVNPKHFPHIPFIIKRAVKKLGHDFLVRKSSKGFGYMLQTGVKSEEKLDWFFHLREAEIQVGNDAHGNLGIYNGKKKKYAVDFADEIQTITMTVREIESREIVLCMKGIEDIPVLCKLIQTKSK